MSNDESPRVVLIAAVSRNGVIGRGGSIPWKLSADMVHFRATTAGCPVIMGRRTWDSLSPKFRPLPGRTNVVVTRQEAWQAPGALVARSFDDALVKARLACDAGRKIFVMGGAELYALALPLADELELTEVHAEVSGDAWFPGWNRTEFIEAQREAHPATGPDSPAFDFVIYRRKT
jgi:dihydrofolate reductase